MENQNTSSSNIEVTTVFEQLTLTVNPIDADAVATMDIATMTKDE